jgi:hypothetical protein
LLYFVLIRDTNLHVLKLKESNLSFVSSISTKFDEIFSLTVESQTQFLWVTGKSKDINCVVVVFRFEKDVLKQIDSHVGSVVGSKFIEAQKFQENVMSKLLTTHKFEAREKEDNENDELETNNNSNNENKGEGGRNRKRQKQTKS